MKKRIWRVCVEWVSIVVGALLLALVLKATVVQTFYIPSASMLPTLEIGDRIVVSKLAFRLGEVERRDLAVFSKPTALVNVGINDFIKRVIGLPGEEISSRDGQVYINGKLLPEPYLQAGEFTSDLPTTKIPDGHYFVMGDNRKNSSDSRFFGPIPSKLLVGEPFIRIWPLSRFNFP
ncbi:MAG: signal peptidase I [Actinomycetota bacterium]